MRIFTKAFVENAKILNSVILKGHQVYESVYFNFNDSYAYFSNPHVNLRLNFLFESQSDENLENFLVSFEKFLILCNLYDYIDYIDGVFSNGDETFEFSTLKDDIDISNFNKFETSDEFITLDKKVCESILLANKYAENEIVDSPLAGVFLNAGRIIATNRYKLYDEKVLDCDVIQDLALPLFISKIIVSNLDLSIKIIELDNHLCIKIGEVLQIIAAKIKSLKLPDIFSDNFINSYNHDKGVSISKKVFLTDLKLLTPFMKDVPNNRIELEFKNSEIHVHVKDFNKITKIIPLISIDDEIIDQKIWLNQNTLLTILSDFTDDTINIKIKEEAMALNFLSNDYKHIVMVKLKD